MSRFGRRQQRQEERSAEERERARWEREHRRALREGREPPPEPAWSAPAPEPAPPQEPDAKEGQPPAAEPLPAEPVAGQEPPSAEPVAGQELPPTEPVAGQWPPPAEPPAAGPPAAEPPTWEPPPADEPPTTLAPHAGAASIGRRPPPEDPPPADANAEDVHPLTEPLTQAGRAGARDEDVTSQDTVAWELPPPDPPVPAPPPPPVDVDEEGRGDPGELPPAPVEGRRTVKLPRAAHGERPVVGTYVIPSDEEPAGTKTVHFESQPGAPGMPSRGLGVPPRRRRGLARRIVPLVLLCVLAVMAYAGYRVFQPGYGPGAGQVAVTIPGGAGASQIGEILEREGVVDSSTWFAIRARLDGGQGLRSGGHTLKRDMPYGQVLAALRAAPQAAATLNVTLLEGPSARENAKVVRDAGLRGDYVRAVRRARMQARGLGLPRAATSAEGFLFPSTYELRRGSTAADLVERQLGAFGEQVAEVDFTAARRAKLTRYDVLIIASMVEREAQVAKERPIIAGVIYNRLRQGMPLGIDATIRYAENNWTRPLRVSELERDTPYNTRLRAGLPPTPIGNPGLASIRAAARPARHDFLFYVVKPCGNGAHAFSASDARFQRDVAAYNRARDARGGKDPSRC